MAEFENPQSRNEALLQNILGAENELEAPMSRNEKILHAILGEDIPLDPPQSRIEELLLEIKEQGMGGDDDFDLVYTTSEYALNGTMSDDDYAELQYPMEQSTDYFAIIVCTTSEKKYVVPVTNLQVSQVSGGLIISAGVNGQTDYSVTAIVSLTSTKGIAQTTLRVYNVVKTMQTFYLKIYKTKD